MKEPALVIIKPDGISKKLVGNILTKFAQTGLDLVALKTAKPTKRLAQEHYKHIRGTPFFKGTIKYFMGDFHRDKKLIAIIYYGEKAIKKCRKIAGATNPEDAHPESIRGSYGRIIQKGRFEIYENVVHVSSDKREARREIMLWFEPADITVDLYATRNIKYQGRQKRIWK